MNRFQSLWPLLLLSAVCHAAPAVPVLGNQPGGSEDLSMPMRVLLSLTLLTFLPAIFMSLTPFLRIITVMHFLRQALGTQSTPSNQILAGLALFLSLFLVQPVTRQVYQNAWQPMQEGKITPQQAFDEGSKPVKKFLLKFAREREIQLFLEMSKAPAPNSPADLDLTILAPAYILSELKAGFQIGAILYLPFLVIDIVVASITLSIGMVQLPPAMVSAPFKILLFVLIDGWNLIIGSLVKSLL